MSPLIARLRFNPELPILRGLTVAFAYLYFFRFVGIYRDPGSVNEWLHLSQIGLTGGDHWSFLSQTYSLPTFARMVGVTTPEAWRTLTVLLALVGFSLFMYTVHRSSLRVVDFAVVVMILTFSPFARATFNGQADYDGLTLISTAFFLISNHPIVAILSGLLMGATNPEQSVITLVCLSILWFAIDRQKLKMATLTLGSLFIANVIIRLILTDPDVTVRLSANLNEDYLSRLTDTSRLLSYFPHFFAGSWLFVIIILYAAYKRSHKASVLLFLTVILIPGFAFLTTSDGIRVFTLVATPVIVVAATNVLPHVSRRILTIGLLVTLLFQGLYLSQGWDNFEPIHPTMFENVNSRPEPLD